MGWSKSKLLSCEMFDTSIAVGTADAGKTESSHVSLT